MEIVKCKIFYIRYNEKELKAPQLCQFPARKNEASIIMYFYVLLYFKSATNKPSLISANLVSMDSSWITLLNPGPKGFCIQRHVNYWVTAR